MPALRLFGRRWLIAGDDIPGPAIFLAVFHLVWVALLSAWLGEIKGPQDCEGVGPYYVAVGGLLTVFFSSFLLETASAIVAFRGSIFETKKRKALPSLIYLNALCVLAQIGFNAYASYLITQKPPLCQQGSGMPWNPVAVMHAVVWSTWVIIICLLGFIIAAYNLYPDYKNPKDWERQCACLAISCLCCPMMGTAGSKKEYNGDSMMAGAISQRLGSLFALMFSHIDLTPSDVIVAFGLALNKERLRRKIIETAEKKAREQGNELRYRSRERLRMGGISRASPTSSADDLLEEEYGDGFDRTVNGMENGGGGASNNISMRMYNNNGTGADVHMELGYVDEMTLAEAAHYMKYAFAAYGWMLYVYEKKTTGVFQLCCGRNCGLWLSVFSRQRTGRRYAESPLHAPFLNMEAIIQAANLEEKDLFDVRSEGESPNVLPYFICADHEKKKIIVAIRGSLSMGDVVRDLLFEPADLDGWVLPDNASVTQWDAPLPPIKPAGATTQYAAHSGIFEATRSTLQDLQQRGKLAELLLGPNPKFPDYSLLICGHSLGAGCAYLLSVRLKSFFHNLKCWAFSPPGGLATSTLAYASDAWCTSVVCGKEMIPRITLQTFERTRDELVHCAARCRKPKTSLLLGWIAGRVWPDTELFYTPESIPAEPQAWLDEYKRSLEDSKTQREYVELASKFGPPGKVLYLRPSGRKAVQSNRNSWFRTFSTTTTTTVVRDYKAVWVDGNKLVEQGIVLSGRMWFDHYPDYCLAVLRRLAVAGGGGASAEVSDAAGSREVRNRLLFARRNN